MSFPLYSTAMVWLQTQQFLLFPFLKCFGLSNNTQKSTSTIDVLHSQDLLEEILLRLHPSSVVRIKTVCKQWYEINSNPNFLRRHTVYFHKYKRLLPCILLQKHCPDKKQPLLLCFDQDNKPWYRRECETLQLYSFIPRWEKLLSRHGTIRILHSCNGLVLLLSQPNNDVFVCNPLMKKYVQIPWFEPTKGLEHVVSIGLNLSFDPLISLDYKIIGLFRIDYGRAPHYRYSTMVYSSLDRSWRVCKPQVTFTNISRVSEGVFMNGAIHWPPAADGKYLFSFVIESEFLQTTLLPGKSDLFTSRSWHYIGASRDHLYLYEEGIPHNSEQERYHYVLYEIMSDYTVKEIDILRVQNNEGGRFSPLCFHNDGEEVLYCSKNGFVHKVYFSPKRSKTIGSLSHLALSYATEGESNRTWDALLPYTNTLFPLE